MKHILWLILIWAFQQMAIGGEIAKTKRIHQIETKFKIVFVEQNNPKIWMFAGLLDEQGHALPIAVPIDATDRDLMVATIASVNCALYYIQKQEQESQKTTIKFVSDFDPFNMPTHPPYAGTDSSQGF